MEGKTETRIFRRELFLAIKEPGVSDEVARRAAWAILADGREATFEDGSDDGWTKAPDDEPFQFIVSRDWTEPLDQEVK